MKKSILSFVLMGLFLYGMKASAFFPSLQMFKDTQWDFSLFPAFGLKKLDAFVSLVFAGIGLWGWTGWIRRTFLSCLDGPLARLAALAATVSLFSFYCFALGVNGVLIRFLVELFFLVGFFPGFFEALENRQFFRRKIVWELLGLVLLVWAFEYLSPPIIWDAVLDHFRFAEEVARLHQIPFHWMNHTGDMPKFAETLLAGFWALGGETLAKLLSGLSAVLTAYLFWVIAKEKGFSNRVGQWVFWSCPLFLALFAWGYVEGFLAFYEMLALYCLWQFFEQPKVKVWVYLCAFFLGVAFSIKYTAVLAILGCDALLIYHNIKYKTWGSRFWPVAVLMLLPMAPWVIRNELANGNPLYPLATQWLGGPPGYNTHMESSLLEDTGKPAGLSVVGWFWLLWNSFFTPNNGVGAAWTPLVLMSLPWWGKMLKDRFTIFLLTFTAVFLAAWLIFCTSLRHASGAVLVLALIAAVVWDKALREDGLWAKATFGLGCLLSLWLCVSAQLTTTAPYASALGLEDPLKRLQRNFSFNLDTYAAYRDIENDSSPYDKVVALGVFQTYPLQRTSFVDFYWKKPTLLSWAGDCKTAEDLAARFKKEGARYVLYQREEAIHSFGRNKHFQLEGMSEKEYLRFWSCYMESVDEFENTFVYRLKEKPFPKPILLQEVPGVQEPGFYEIQKADFNGDKKKAYELALAWTDRYPFIAEGWRQRAQVAQNLSPEDAFVSAYRATQLGLQDIGLCQVLSMGLQSQGQQAKAKVWDNLVLFRETIEDKKEEGALGFYRNSKN